MIESVQKKSIMKTIQIANNLRYISLDDEEGSVGIFIVHEGERVRYTIEVNSKEELRAAIETFQANPVGVWWLNHIFPRRHLIITTK